MNKKFELTSNTVIYAGKTLYQIRALARLELKFGFVVEAGDLGGVANLIFQKRR